MISFWNLKSTFTSSISLFLPPFRSTLQQVRSWQLTFLVHRWCFLRNVRPPNGLLLSARRGVASHSHLCVFRIQWRGNLITWPFWTHAWTQYEHILFSRRTNFLCVNTFVTKIWETQMGGDGRGEKVLCDHIFTELLEDFSSFKICIIWPKNKEWLRILMSKDTASWTVP